MTEPSRARRKIRPLRARLLEVAAIVHEAGGVEKRGANRGDDYTFTTAEDVSEAVRKALIDRHILVVPGIRDVGHTMGRSGVLSTIFTRYTFTCTKSDETLEIDWASAGFDASDKGIPKALTGGLKYLLTQLFHIATGDDPERESGVVRVDDVPTIPKARAERLGKRIADAKIDETAWTVKLAELGVAMLPELNVDQAEEFEAWLDAEVAEVSK